MEAAANAIHTLISRGSLLGLKKDAAFNPRWQRCEISVLSLSRRHALTSLNGCGVFDLQSSLGRTWPLEEYSDAQWV